jgi:transcriptional regulator with XRE-family HTH domain
LKRARTKNEIGLRVMARRLGISHSFLHQLENGQRRWSPLLQARFITHLYQ